MKLNEYEVNSIKEVVSSFDQEAKIYIFDPKMDDSKNSADIDLLLLSQNLKHSDAVNIKGQLTDRIGDQSIDIIITSGTGHPLTRAVLLEGTQL